MIRNCIVKENYFFFVALNCVSQGVEYLKLFDHPKVVKMSIYCRDSKTMRIVELFVT